MINRLGRFILVVITCAFLPSIVYAFHSESRYFPWLDKTDSIILKKRSQFNPELFYVAATTAYKRGGSSGGIPELWGSYSLSDVALSCHHFYGLAVDPIQGGLTGAEINALNNKPVTYNITGKVKAQGLTLAYDRDLKFKGLSVGAWLPIAHISTTSGFGLFVDGFTNANNPPPAGVDKSLVANKLDQIRRDLHERMGFKGDAWDATGIGDLDLHVRWNYFIDHRWMMRSIDSYIQVGILCPTGLKTSLNEPLSVPLGSNGHWGMYFDALSEFELKQDWKLGFLLSALYQFKNSKNMRLPLGKEPAIYTPLTGKVEVDPGITFKISPYFTLENLTDGVNFQFRYTYLKHTADSWQDKRSDTAIRSYLDQSGSSVGLSADDRAKNIAHKEWLSRWSFHVASFQVTYDSKQAMKNWMWSPNFYAVYDFPIGGNGVAKVHQVSLGACLHF
jgi:hypothetical protein